MSRINITGPNQAEIDHAWIKSNQDQLIKHPAWMNDMPESKANWHLERKSPFTYLLRSGEKERAYFISFVKEDGSIKHQRFTLEVDPNKGTWLFRNGIVATPKGWTNELTAESLDELIPMMMHCKKEQCKMLNDVQA
jgi:hypothetical protein